MCPLKLRSAAVAVAAAAYPVDHVFSSVSMRAGPPQRPGTLSMINLDRATDQQMSSPAHDADPLRTPPCPDCDGLGSKVLACACTATGEKMLSGYDAEPGAAEPLEDCNRCHGHGSITLQCNTCAGAGTVRAQLVITVVNVDSGVVASETVLPGIIAPQWLPSELEGDHRWALPLRPVVDRLIGAVGGDLITTHDNTMSLAWSLPVPGGWNPDLPTAARLELEAAALGRAQGRTRHRHFVTTAAASARNNAQNRLAHLAVIADRLHVDLCCARYATVSDELDRPTQRGWSVSFELPGIERPSPRCSNLTYPSLAEACEAADSLELLQRLRHRIDPADPAPARFINDTSTVAAAHPAGLSVADLERQLAALVGDLRGAVAIRRNGAWHVAALEPDETLEDYRETDTGQIRHRHIRTWRRSPAPPSPNWWGDEIPETPCPQCATGTTWVRCECFDTLTDAPDPHCDKCTGTGNRRGTSCSLCGRIGRIRLGYTVSVADLSPGGAVHHYNVAPGLDPGHEPAVWPDFPDMTYHQLPEVARLTQRLFADGVDLADLRDVTGLQVSSSLIDSGIVAPTGTPVIDLVHQHVVDATAGRPGARVLLQWAPPARATVAQTASIAWGLGFDLVLGAEDRNADQLAGTSMGGMRWGVALMRAGQEPDQSLTGAFGKRRLSLALQACVDNLQHLLNISPNEKPGPLDVVPAPQQPVPPQIAAADRLEVVLSTLASRCGGLNASTVITRIAPTGVEFFTLTSGAEARYRPRIPMVEAPTLKEALSELGFAPSNPDQ